MLIRSTLSTAVIFVGLALAGVAQEQPSKPIELEVLQAYLGVWDAEIEVWPAGSDAASITFKGVETNRAYGEYWIASDLDSEFMGQTVRVHSIIGYDLDKQMLVGTNIDDGPYAARLTGEYDAASKTVHWKTEGKDPSGNPIVQRTSITHESADERVLVLAAPGAETGEFSKFMEIRFVRRKQD